MNTNGLGVAARMHCPRLKKLLFEYSYIELDEGRQMIAAEWPVLEELEFARVRMNQDGISALWQGRWPRLKHLKLHHCYDLPMKLRAVGWPMLQKLRILESHLGPKEAALLAKGSWCNLVLVDLS